MAAPQKSQQGGLIAAGPKTVGRLKDSVQFTERYKERLKALLEPFPEAQVVKAPAPVRVLLLQDCWNGQDAIAVPLGRDEITSGFYISVVGDNSLSTSNTFKLQARSPIDATHYVPIFTTAPISQVAQPFDILDAMIAVEDSINYYNTKVLFGNPYYDVNFVQTDTIQTDAKGNQFFPLGMWYVQFDGTVLPQYPTIDLAVVLDTETSVTGLVNYACQRSFDIPSPEITVVKDIDYRDKSFPWQAGTIATCLDFIDIGYGILRSSARTFSSVPTN